MSYVQQVHGVINPVLPITELHAQISGPVDASQQNAAIHTGGLQPGETINGATGEMVVASPSASGGTARMVPGAGNRAPETDH